MEALGLVHAIETVSKNACNQPDSRTVEIIFTSPPYRKKRIYDDEVPVLGNEKSPKEYAENLVSHLGDSKRVLKGTALFFLGYWGYFLQQKSSEYSPSSDCWTAGRRVGIAKHNHLEKNKSETSQF